MQEYTYLLINLGTISIPLIASFYRPFPFIKHWKAFLAGCLPVAIAFILWDVAFTKMGIWGFNEAYLSGLYLANLPLEEVLFFFCIPFACTFTFFSLGYFFSFDKGLKTARIISLILAGLCILVGLFHLDKWYTTTAFFSAAIFLLIQYLFKWKGLVKFLITFGLILIPFYVVNGLLTGWMIEEQVVWYNDAHNLGIRIITIPLDDHFYSLCLQGFVVFLFDRQLGKQRSVLN